MSDRKFYLICDDNCKFEGMTKEQIFAAITEATGVTPSGGDDAFITKIKESKANKSLSFWLGTEAEFNALGVSANCVRVKVDENGKVYLSYNGKIYGDDIAEGAVTKEFLAVVPLAGWEQQTNGFYRVSVPVDGMLGRDRPKYDINMEGMTAEEAEAAEEAFDCIALLNTYDGGFYVDAYETPEVAIPIKMEVARK